jgi:hypothetical protein
MSRFESKVDAAESKNGTDKSWDDVRTRRSWEARALGPVENSAPQERHAVICSVSGRVPCPYISCTFMHYIIRNQTLNSGSLSNLLWNPHIDIFWSYPCYQTVFLGNAKSKPAAKQNAGKDPRFASSVQHLLRLSWVGLPCLEWLYWYWFSNTDCMAWFHSKPISQGSACDPDSFARWPYQLCEGLLVVSSDQT